VTVAYSDFLASKTQLANAGGFEPTHLPNHLFDFQRDLVEWSVRQGRGAIFADCGLGKTPMELAWAQNVHAHTGKPVLLITPLAVGFQIEAEANKFGAEAAMSRDGKAVAPITITNYERVDKFNPDTFGGVVCDESSAIKAFDGQRRAIVTEFLRTMPYRLLGTATAAPNDYIELGTSSEALGELGYMDMLNRWFVNDNQTSDIAARRNRQGKWLRGSAGSGWRFKGHAVDPFWRWVASWARAIRKPSDYGYDDGAFILPPLDVRTTVVEARTPNPDALFDMPAIGLQEEREALRRTLDERCEAAAEKLADAELAVAWCHLNDESRLLTRLIDGAVEVAGSEPVEQKEEKLRAFSAGEIRALVTKPSIGAWGLNWQHVHRMTYFPSHSYEQYYQSIRRSWRFGQTQPVEVDVITTTGGKGILKNLQAKADRADAMFDALIRHMNHAMKVQRGNDYTTPMEVPAWLR
jgi:hypothetical protein